MVILEHNKRKVKRIFDTNFIRLTKPWRGLQKLNLRPPTGTRTLAWRPHTSQDDNGSIADATHQADLDAKDPYGISGTWDRIVAYIDYSVFNFHNNRALDSGLDATMAPFGANEQLILIRMHLLVTEVVPEDKCPAGQSRLVRFRGVTFMQGMDPEQGRGRLCGDVYTTSEGEIRWSGTTTLDDGQMWASDSLQIGPAQSQRGTIGLWYDA